MSAPSGRPLRGRLQFTFPAHSQSLKLPPHSTPAPDTPPADAAHPPQKFPQSAQSPPDPTCATSAAPAIASPAKPPPPTFCSLSNTPQETALSATPRQFHCDTPHRAAPAALNIS